MTNDRISALEARIAVLEAEAEVRRIQARYMFLCDTPNPEFGSNDDADRIARIMELFAPDAVWEGVGEYYDGQFGRAEGWDAIKAHFQNFWRVDADPKLILNCHYLTSEQIRVAPDAMTAEGNWVHMQPWLFSDGKAMLRSSRLFNKYRICEDGQWRFTQNRTENVFIAPLPATWASDYPSKSSLMMP
ncbi:nuclear transport factor 2 family protein [Octadecabacter sp.]|nr:nuclear transport factor 2 family protein [Octadecabacter sp.]